MHRLTRDFLAAAQAGHEAAADALADELDGVDAGRPRLAEAAEVYASWGWPVFPCRPGLKMPAVPRREGGQGLHDATVDVDQIRTWWQRWPHANVALATGHGFDVLDVDPQGLAWLMDLQERDDEHLPASHGQVCTPRGGAHVYLPATGGGNLAGFATGVDYRGVGGYVLAPPSVLTPAAYTGKRPPELRQPWRYTWSVYPSPVIKSGGGS